jgi:hypothetical protein
MGEHIIGNARGRLNPEKHPTGVTAITRSTGHHADKPFAASDARSKMRSRVAARRVAWLIAQGCRGKTG